MTESRREYLNAMCHYWASRLNLWQTKLERATCPLVRKKIQKALDLCESKYTSYRAELAGIDE